MNCGASVLIAMGNQALVSSHTGRKKNKSNKITTQKFVLLTLTSLASDYLGVGVVSFRVECCYFVVNTVVYGNSVANETL